jgi:V-type H+-transporting ATPase subunit E
MSQQITKSTLANRTRLRVLSARQSLLDDLFEEARSKVGKAAEGKDYDKILAGLILEGMYLLHEPKVQVRARGKDKDRVEKAIKQAANEYKKNMGRQVEAAIDDKNPLPDSSYVGQCFGNVRGGMLTWRQIRRSLRGWREGQNRDQQHL